MGHHVIGFVARVGARAAEALELDIDQPGVKGIEGFVLKTKAFDDARAIVFDEDVVVRQHAEQHVAPLGLAEIQGQAALVGIPVAEIGRVVAAHGQGASGFSAARGLDFHDVGPHPGHGLGARGPRLVLSHIENSNSVECRHGVLLGEAIA